MATRNTTRSVGDRQGMPGAVSDLGYSYDPAGNVTKIGDTPAGSDADNQCFTYDPLRRLSDAWTTTAATCGTVGSGVGGPAPYWTTFTYDAVGNRLTEDSHGVGLAAAQAQSVRTYTYPATGAARPHAVTSIGAPGTPAAASVYQYDAAGNMISRPGQTMTWTPASQLNTVTAGGNTTTNTYDADGTLVAAKDSLGSTIYLDGAEVHYTKATGQASSTRYLEFGGDTVAVRTGSGINWVSHDNHGTDILSIESAHLVASGKRTDPFGNPRGVAPAQWPSKRGFVGGIDQGVGLIHLGAREYDTDTGAFLSVDPVLDPHDPQQLNAYAYSSNNPTTMSDPDGLHVMEGDSGGWQDSHASPRPKHHPGGSGGGGGGSGGGAAPHQGATSHAYRNDFGGRCQRGDPCGAITRIAALHPFHYVQGPGLPGPYVNEYDRPHRGPGRIVWDIPQWSLPIPLHPSAGPITNRNGGRDDCHENRQAHVVCWYEGLDGPTPVAGPLTGFESPTDRKRRLDDEAAHPIEQQASTRGPGSAAMCTSAGGQLIIAISFETCDDGSSGWSLGIGLGAGVSVSSAVKVQSGDGCHHGTERYIQSGVETPFGGIDAQASATPGLQNGSASVGMSQGLGASALTVGLTGSFC
jgi:RHS repeat-associated protein